jgi:hypothetical protein
MCWRSRIQPSDLGSISFRALVECAAQYSTLPTYQHRVDLKSSRPPQNSSPEPEKCYITSSNCQPCLQDGRHVLAYSGCMHAARTIATRDYSDESIPGCSTVREEWRRGTNFSSLEGNMTDTRQLRASHCIQRYYLILQTVSTSSLPREITISAARLLFCPLSRQSRIRDIMILSMGEKQSPSENTITVPVRIPNSRTPIHCLRQKNAQRKL